MKMSRKKIAILVAALLIVAGIVIQAVWRPFAHRKATNAGEVVLDIHHPDAVIDSEALARLPRDMVRVPLLHDVLTQDFVDHALPPGTPPGTEPFKAFRRMVDASLGTVATIEGLFAVCDRACARGSRRPP